MLQKNLCPLLVLLIALPTCAPSSSGDATTGGDSGDGVGASGAALAPLEFEYADFALWEHARGDDASALSWWVSQLEGAPELFDSPGWTRAVRNTPRGGARRRGARVCRSSIAEFCVLVFFFIRAYYYFLLVLLFYL